MPADQGVEHDDTESLDTFIAQVQSRALMMARLATRSTDEALDLVQEAMFSFVHKYAGKPQAERRPLFFRCLNNRIVDWHRRNTRRGRWLVFGSNQGGAAGDGPDLPAVTAENHQPDRLFDQDRFANALEARLETLPLRQRQVFLLRAWEGLDVRETAKALGIGSGSVKTHYFRALAALREALEEFHE